MNSRTPAVLNLPRYRRFIAARLRSLEAAYMELEDDNEQREAEPRIERIEWELRRVARELGAIA